METHSPAVSVCLVVKGATVGVWDGITEGDKLGMLEGVADGVFEGVLLGLLDGVSEGIPVGLLDDSVGNPVGEIETVGRVERVGAKVMGTTVGDAVAVFSLQMQGR